MFACLLIAFNVAYDNNIQSAFEHHPGGITARPPHFLGLKYPGNQPEGFCGKGQPPGCWMAIYPGASRVRAVSVFLFLMSFGKPSTAHLESSANGIGNRFPTPDLPLGQCWGAGWRIISARLEHAGSLFSRFLIESRKIAQGDRIQAQPAAANDFSVAIYCRCQAGI